MKAVLNAASAVALVLLQGCASAHPQQDWDDRIRIAARQNPPLLIVSGESVGEITLGMKKDEVRRALGAPEMQRGGPNTWEYLTGGFALMFSADDDRLVAILGGASCPPDSALVEAFKGRTREGLGMGSSPKEITKAMGEPERVWIEGAAEYLYYPKLGNDFIVWHGEATHVTIRRKTRR